MDRSPIPNSRKRKASTPATFPLGVLHDDLLERVLARLPPSSFFSLRSVCRRFSSVSASPSFRLACSQITSREPWFLMVDDHPASLAFDSSTNNWRTVKGLDGFFSPKSKSIPVASAGGLVCYKTSAGGLVVSNPVTGMSHELPAVTRLTGGNTVHAIAMRSSSSARDRASYKVFLVYGEMPNNLSFLTFDSVKNSWEEVSLVRKADCNLEVDVNGEEEEEEEEEVYFLSKTGEVVATTMQRSPSKQYSSVITSQNGEEVLYFLSHSGAIVSCNLTQRSYLELPRLLPVYCEYSIDVLECNGEMVVAVLYEFLETASLRLWMYGGREKGWVQVAAVPPALSHGFYRKKADVNCVGHGDEVVVCVSSGEGSSCLRFDMKRMEWSEMPKCVVGGREREFLSAFSFEPRLEAIV